MGTQVTWGTKVQGNEIASVKNIAMHCLIKMHWWGSIADVLYLESVVQASAASAMFGLSAQCSVSETGTGI